MEAGRVLPAIRCVDGLFSPASRQPTADLGVTRRAVKEELPEAVVSVDTFYAEVARAAVEAGADIVNDISGGTLDARMHSTVGHSHSQVFGHRV